MRMLIFLVATLGVLVAPGGAEPYWIAYEADDFPENVGWRRIFGDENGPGQGGAERSLEDGVFILDTRRDHMIYDYYKIQREMDPDPGETFVAEWRLRVVEANRSFEATVEVARDDPPGRVRFEYMEDLICNSPEHWIYPIEPYVFHTYRLESRDMVAYSLCIDGEHVHDGFFDTPVNAHSFFVFGDPGYGGAVTSLSEWDYVRFGVVPEPTCLMMFVLSLALLVKRPRR